MRIFNRVHVLWFLAVCLATFCACLCYLWTFHPQRLPPPAGFPRLSGDTPGYVNVGATPLGLIFGAAAFGIFIFAGLLGLRKKVPLWRVGTVQRWLRAHIWLTLLTIPLVILHSGFRLGGPMTTALVVLYAVVMVSGIYGLTLQHHLPHLMKEKLPTEIVYQQIPYIRSQLCRAAENMRERFTPNTQPAATSTADRLTSDPDAINSFRNEALRATARYSRTEESEADAAPEPADAASEAVLAGFIEQQVLPYLQARRGDRMRLARVGYAEDVFRMVKLRVTPRYREVIEQLQASCQQRRLLDLQVRFQHWLHGWLFIHVPLSYLLILMTAWHAYLTLFRY